MYNTSIISRLRHYKLHCLIETIIDLDRKLLFFKQKRHGSPFENLFRTSSSSGLLRNRINYPHSPLFQSRWPCRWHYSSSIRATHPILYCLPLGWPPPSLLPPYPLVSWCGAVTQWGCVTHARWQCREWRIRFKFEICLKAQTANEVKPS